MQYHWVVMYDTETESYDVDWDMTYQVLDGIMYDPEHNDWFMPYDESNVFDSVYDRLTSYLDSTLDKHHKI